MAERSPQRPYTHQRATDEEDDGAFAEFWASYQKYCLESNLLELASADRSAMNEPWVNLDPNGYQVPS